MRSKFKQNHEKEEKRQRRNMIFVGVFIIAIMVMSTFAYVATVSGGGSSQTISEYGQNFRIVNQEGVSLWQTRFDGEPREFFRLPSEVEGYYTPGLRDFTNSPALTVSFDNVLLDQDAISFFAAQLIDLSDKKQFGVAFTSEPLNGAEIPVVTCANATAQFMVMELSLTNETATEGLLYADNCLTLKAFSVQDLTFYIEKMRYATYGVEFNEG